MKNFFYLCQLLLWTSTICREDERKDKSSWKWSPRGAPCHKGHETPNPGFLVIGAEKSGTTSLYYYLGQHPSIRLAAISKEPYSLLHVLVDGRYNVSLNHNHHYRPEKEAKDSVHVDAQGALEQQQYIESSNQKRRASFENPMWRWRHFTEDDAREAYYEYIHRAYNTSILLRPGHVTFESSPRYYTYPELASVLQQVIPCARIVMTLREPIRRAESQYWHDICTPGYMKRLARTNPFFEGRTSGKDFFESMAPRGFLSLQSILESEATLWKKCTSQHGPLPISLQPNTNPTSSMTAAQQTVRVLWSCMSTPLLVNQSAFSRRRVYFGYLIPGLYALPLEQWLDVYDRKDIHFLDFDSWTDSKKMMNSLEYLTNTFLGLSQWTRVARESITTKPRKFMAAPCFPKNRAYRKLGEKLEKDHGGIFEEEASLLSSIRSQILLPANLLLASLIGETWGWMEVPSKK